MPYADIFSKTNVSFVQAEISEINLVENKVKTDGNMILDYDYLIIALGSVSSDFNIENNAAELEDLIIKESL